MKDGRQHLRIENLFSYYFSNILKFFIINLIFFIPTIIIFSIVYFLSSLLFSGQNILILFIGIIFIFPFYSGVVLITRNISRGEKISNIFKLYFNTVKENFFSFLLHGLILYLVSIISYFSITFYAGMAKNSSVYYFVLAILILVVLFMFFSFFYIPLMNVTYDIKLINIYKNSLLMALGEIKNNFFALFSLIVLFAILGTLALLCSFNLILMIISIIIIIALFLPALASYVVSYFVFDNMNLIITSKDAKTKVIEDSINNVSNIKKAQTTTTIIEDDFSDIDVSKLKNPDDYIFHNGKMVKQSVIIDKLSNSEEESNG